MDDKIFTVPEVAEYLKVGKKAVYELIRQKKIQAIKIGKSIRITESALKEFKEA